MSDLQLPLEPLDEGDPRDLVRRLAPDLLPRPDWTLRFILYSLGAIVSVYPSAWVAFALFGPLWPAQTPVIAGVLASLVPLVLGEVVVRRVTAAKTRQLWSRLEDEPWHLYDAIAQRFRAAISEHRRRTLGPNSEWARARQPLSDALEEAKRATAYWSQRVSDDPGNQLPASQLETAEALSEKFRSALSELDRRSTALVTFFNQCEARLATLRDTQSDYEESRRLADLSSHADDIVEDAHSTLVQISSQFLGQAVRVAEALGGLERLGLLEAAAEVSVDSIDVIADRILKSSSEERVAIQRLMVQLVE